MKRRGIKNIIFIAVILIAGIWLIRKISKLPAFHDIFSSQPVIIDQTPIVIKEIKSIAQLVTVTSYDEVVVDSLVYNRTAAFIDAFRAISPLAMLPSLQKQLVIIGKGKVLAGTNLQKLDSSHITISSDTISIQLPNAEILDAIINPGDFETFEERGVWSDQEVTAVKLKARQKIIDRAIQQNILSRANEKAKSIIETFLSNAGYKVVNVGIRYN